MHPFSFGSVNAQLVRPDVELDPNIPSAESHLKQYGGQSLSYSVLQPGLQYFGNPYLGFIAYRKKMGVTLALGNPICALHDAPYLLDAFIKSQRGALLFAQVQGNTADILDHLGMNLTPAGLDTMIDVQHFTTRGVRMRGLRRQCNKALSAGLTITEALDTAAERQQLRKLSEEWIATRHVKSRELEFLVRPLSDAPEPGVRIFVAKHDNQLLGFVLFDPIYQNGACTGYAASTLRCYPDAPTGTIDAIIVSALRQFRDEGIQTLSLGVRPLHALAETARQHGAGAKPLYWTCRALYALPQQPIFNIRGLSFHKGRYRPFHKPVFIATRGRLGIREMTALTRACRIL